MTTEKINRCSEEEDILRVGVKGDDARDRVK